MIGTDSYHIVIDLRPTEQYDYRYSSIESTNIDMSESSVPIKAKFLGDGIIRLFRQFDDDDDDNDDDNDNIDINEKYEGGNALGKSFNGDETIVAIVSIPTYFTATDVLGFIGDLYMKHITNVRILRSEKPNRFLVLLKFNDLVKTAEFQYQFDGKLFNSMEPEACHVVYVKSVRVEDSNNTTNDTLLPFLINDPFTERDKSTISKHDPHLELPSCPVCLERMDSDVTGLLTIPCQHTFHCQCLSKWKDDTCPVCRYSNNVSNHKIRRSTRRLLQYSTSRAMNQSSGQNDSQGNEYISDESELCSECLAREKLWICLICGNIGCDRYAPEQHSLKHFINTGHCFAMEIRTSRVWDYAGDSYVHRLVANESDGKLVELPEKNNDQPSSMDKLDEVGFEYSQLLISQLSSQQEYYESLLSQHNIPNGSRNGSTVSVPQPGNVGSSTSQPLQPQPQQNVITDLEVKIDELGEQLNQLNCDTIPSLRAKLKLKDGKINVLVKELNETKILNESLSNKVDYLTNKHKTLTDEKQDLSDQVKDLMFFLDSQEKFKNESEDVREGTVVVNQNLTGKNSKPKKKKK